MFVEDDAGSQVAIDALSTYAIGYSKYVTLSYTLIVARFIEPISKPAP